jgi:NAD(P)-dependent dehydrogenase (short-subunit alcohol dehydrogenase family)
VLIVGASSGIGLATALDLAPRGDRLVLAARSAPALERAAAACVRAGAAQPRTLSMDVGVEADVHRVIEEVLETEGRLDAVIHTATVMGYGSIEQMPAATFERVVDTAIHGTANLARTVMPIFRRQGHGTFVIVNSLLGSVAVPNMGAYATAKWGQRAIARTLQQEVQAEPNIHVCIVSPGSTNTPIYYLAANYTGRAARPPVPVLQPERLGAAVAGLLDRPRKHVSIPVGPLNPLVVAGFRFLPYLYDRLVGPLFKLGAQTHHDEQSTEGNVFVPIPEQDRLHGHWPDR